MSSAVAIWSNPKVFTSTETILRYSVRNKCGISGSVDAISFGNFSHFYAVPIPLKYRAALRERHGFFDRIGFDDDSPANGFFYFAKRSIGDDVVVPYDAT